MLGPQIPSFGTIFVGGGGGAAAAAVAVGLGLTPGTGLVVGFSADSA